MAGAQTAAAVMAAELMAIEAGEQAELLPVNSCVVVGAWQTAAAVMAAEMVAIEAGEQAELLLVNSRLAKVRRLHRGGGEEKRPSSARERACWSKSLRTHMRRRCAS